MVDKRFLSFSIFLLLSIGTTVFCAPTLTDWNNGQQIPLPPSCAENLHQQDYSTIDQDETVVLPCRAFENDGSLTLQQVFWRIGGQPVYPRDSSDPRLSILPDYSLVLRNASLHDTTDYVCMAVWKDRQGARCIKDSSVMLSVMRVIEEQLEDFCGRAGPGTPSPNKVPWMVNLYDKRTQKPICGGSLITSYWVLSAAHCLDEYSHYADDFKNHVEVRLGENTWYGTSYEIEMVVQHIDYGGGDFNYDRDLLMIMLKAKVDFSDGSDYAVWPICLPKSGNVSPGETGLMTGWGRLSLTGPQPRRLKKLLLPVQPRTKCQRTIKPGHQFTGHMFCAGRGDGSRDQCEGDSGGPFAVKRSGKWFLAGVVSFGESCDGRRNKYGYYVEVGRLYNWIRDTILDNPPPSDYKGYSYDGDYDDHDGDYVHDGDY